MTPKMLKTSEAAALLRVRADSMRRWACGRRPGPLKPVRVGGRLLWPAEEVRRLLTGAA